MEYISTYTSQFNWSAEEKNQNKRYRYIRIRRIPFLVLTLLSFNSIILLSLLRLCNRQFYIPDMTPIPGYTYSFKPNPDLITSDWPLIECYQPGKSNLLPSSDPNCPVDEIRREPVWFGEPYRDDFKYHLEPNCEEYDYKHMVVFFYSTMYHFNERRKTRLYLMDYLENIIGDKVKAVFIVGVPNICANNTESEYFLQQEAQIFQDILRADIIEKYENLAFKGFAVLQWLQKCSKHTPFYLKMDDDFMINMTAVYKLLPTIPCSYSYSLMCYEPILINSVRKFPSKFLVRKMEYSPDNYPVGCIGHGYIITRQVASRFIEVGKQLGYVPKIDDMFFSAVLRRKSCVSMSVIDLNKIALNEAIF